MNWLTDLLTKAAAGDIEAILAVIAILAFVWGVVIGIGKLAVWLAGSRKRHTKAAEDKSKEEREKLGRTEEFEYTPLKPDKEAVFGRLRGVAGDKTNHVERPEIERAIENDPDGLLIWGPAGCGKTREAAEYALARAQDMRRNQWCFVIDGSASLRLPQEAPGSALDGAVVIFDDLQEHWARYRRLAKNDSAARMHPGEIIREILDYFRSETEWCVAVATVRIEDEATWREMCDDPCMGEALAQFAPHVKLGLVNRTDVERDYLRAACKAREVTWADDDVFDALAEANDGSFLTADDYLDELSAGAPHELTMENARGLKEACRLEWRERVLPRLPAMQQDAVELCSVLSACGLPMARELVLALDRERSCQGLCAGIRYNWGRGKAFNRALDGLAKGAFVESEGEFRPHGSRLADEGRPDLKGEAAQVARALIGLARVDWRNARLQRGFAMWLDRIGSELITRGDVGVAMTAYEASLQIRERLAESDPDNAQWQRDLSVSHNRMGDVRRAQGDLTRAMEAYETSLQIAERLTESDPGNAEWQYDLGIGHERIGTVRQAQGDLARALTAFEAKHSIIQRLAESDPGNAEWQRDLSVSHNKIGDVRVAQGDMAGAMQAYEASLEIAEGLVQSDPGNAGWQYDLGISHERIGAVRQAQGDLDGALQAFEAKHAIIKRLAAFDTGNAGWQRDLAVSHHNMAYVANEAGDAERERQHLLECREILRGMKAKGMHLDPPAMAVLEQLEGMG